jgi:hypothetical protein
VALYPVTLALMAGQRYAGKVEVEREEWAAGALTRHGPPCLFCCFLPVVLGLWLG